MPLTPLDILKRTPKSNCGQCGHPTCLAFAALVAKSGEDPGKCPFLETEGLDMAPTPGTELEELARERDLALIAHLQGKVAEVDFAAIAENLGAQHDPSAPDTLSFRYIGQDVVLTKTGVCINGVEPEDPRDQILLYNYVHSQGDVAPKHDWIGLESLPNSISKVKTLATYCEKRLAQLFSEMSQNEIRRLCERLDGVTDTNASASLGIVVPVLPRIPQYLLYWEAEPEDGFAAQVKVLFDKNVLNYLDLESLVFSAERLADRLADLAS